MFFCIYSVMIIAAVADGLAINNLMKHNTPAEMNRLGCCDISLFLFPIGIEAVAVSFLFQYVSRKNTLQSL